MLISLPVLTSLLFALTGTNANYTDFHHNTKFEQRNSELTSENIDLNNQEENYYFLSSPENDEPLNTELSVPRLPGANFPKQIMNPLGNQFSSDYFYPNKYFTRKYYSHLVDNMPRNRLGICGYTAIAMFFSFFDTYWNDGFIDESYDQDTTITKDDFDNATGTNKYQSPGVMNNITPSSSTLESLKQQIIDNGITDENSDEFKEALEAAIMNEVYGQIDSHTFLGRLFEIALGDGSIRPHYDRSGNQINSGYVNDLGVNYNYVNAIFSDYIQQNPFLAGRVDVVTSQNLPGNEAAFRSEIVDIVKNGRPVLVGGDGFNDLNHDGISDPDEKYGHDLVAYFYDEAEDVLYGNAGWSSPDQSFVNIENIFNLKLSDYWTIRITDQSLTYDKTDNYIFSDEHAYYYPYLHRMYNVIKPQDYGFPDAYNQNMITKEVTLPNTGETFSTNRVRCGFIQNTCINISTVRYAPGLAYLEYTFDKDLFEVEVDMSWWSNNEKVDEYNSNYRIEYKISPDIYYERVNIWNLNLPVDRTNPMKVTFGVPQGFNSIRYYGLALYPENDRNKGRLSIFDMVVIYQ